MTPQPPRAEPLDSASLFRLYAPFVASFLYRQGARGADLEDLVQEVFLIAHRRGGYRPGVASPTTFLARLSLEANLTRRRGDRRSRRDQSSDAVHAMLGRAPSDPAESLATKAALQRLQAALERMEAGQRAVFILYELEQESCESIAAGLELPVGTVYSRLHAARKTFCEYSARDEAGAIKAHGVKKKPEPIPTLRAQPFSRGGVR